MDDTHQSRTSDAAAAATRKRRSSILKSQRPPRTPFSDLEFNVATPTDTTKSRRVSFSKRTGVAEFATNEATTTWKNFYEEHNKSLDLSVNDASKQPIGHIGKRIFDQQFEVEAIDISILKPGERIINTSMNNVNFTQQIALLECTGDDRRLAAPHSNFELSTFTDHQSIVFSNDLATQSMRETIDRIDVNFSDVQNIGSNDDKDDLDEIQKDLERARNNAAYHRSSRNAKDMSEYIELNFDTTNIAMRNEESDMSITDMVHSPKVQDVSKNFSIDKKFSGSTSKDWANDKENIAINPYVTPQESVNFAINEEPDKVLVFDGKRLTIQSEKKNTRVNNLSYTNLPDTSKKIPQRKTIVLNMNDDLPNYVNMQTSGIETSSSSIDIRKQSVIFNDGDLSMTQPLFGKIEQNPSNSKTMVYDNDIGDISVTQAIPNIVILPKKPEVNSDKRRTIVFENDTANISVTQALSNIILPGNLEKVPDKRNMTVHEDETCNISITQAVPTNILYDKDKEILERRRTILYGNDDGNVSITQSVPSHLIAPVEAQNSDKRRTIVYENDTGNISITQAIPTDILLATNNGGNLDKGESGSGKRKTIVFDDDSGDISLTKVVPQNIILPDNETERGTTIVYETEFDVSITQAVPTNLMFLNNKHSDSTVFDNDVGNISITQAIPTNILLSQNPDAPHRRRTVVFEDDTANLSITQAVPKNQVIPGFTDTCKQSTEICYKDDISNTMVQNTADTNKRKTIVYENNEADISMTQVIPANIIIDEAKMNDKSRTIVCKDNTADISNIQTNMLLIDEITENPNTSEKKVKLSEIISQEPKRQTIVFHDEDVSMTEMITKKARESNTNKRKSVTFSDISIIEALPHSEIPEKRKTVVFESENSNLPIIKHVPNIIDSPQSEVFDTSYINKNALETNNMSLDFIIYQTDTTHNVQKWQSKTLNSSNSNTQDSVNEDKKLPTHDIENIIDPNKLEESIKINSSDQMQLLDKPEESEDALSVEPKKSIIFVNLESQSSSDQSEKKKSVLSELLDMSTGSHDGGFDVNKSINVVETKSDRSDENTTKDMNNTANNESMLNISRHSEEGGQINESVESENYSRKTIKPRDDVNNIAPLILDSKKGKKTGIVAEIKNKLVQLKSSISGGKYNFPTNRHYEKILSSDLGGKHKSIKNANDTHELLDMLTELTDKSINYVEKDNNPIVPITAIEHKALENENHAESITVKGNKALKYNNPAVSITLEEQNASENEKRTVMKKILDLEDEKLENPVTVKGSTAFESKNSTIIEPKRLNFAPSRQSIALSREDLINNLSMAQTALQLSRKDMDESENIEDTANDTTIEQYVPHKSIRMSNKIVKTLDFDQDETASDISVKSEVKASPVKKTTFGETSYVNEKNVKPIPSYMKDVSNGIKELMDDLVKPMADVLPFETVGIDKTVNKNSSTCSTQIQANLVTSSQIDVCSELKSESMIDVKQLESLASGIAFLGNEAVARALKSPIQCVSTDASEKSSEFEVCRKSAIRQQTRSPRAERPQPTRVIVFDHDNPLNNVLLGSIDYSKVHKYHPGISSDSLCCPARFDSEQISVNEDEKGYEMERTSQHYNVESRLSMMPVQQAGDASSEKAVDAQSILTSDSKPISVDQSTDAQVVGIKNTEVNTIIAMKGNNELLDGSSSLTLVDDALDRSTFDVNLNSSAISSHEDCSSTGQVSSVKVIYKTDEVASSDNQDPNSVSNDGLVKSQKKCSNAIKLHSPPKREKQKKLSFDLTPKHMSKMPRLSNNPGRTKSPEKIKSLPAERDETEHNKCNVDTRVTEDMEVSPEKTTQITKQKSPRKGKTSPKRNTVTVQQLISEYRVETNINQKLLNEQILRALNDSKSGCSSVDPTTMSPSDDECKSLDVVSSCASSKNEMHTIPSMTTSESVTSSEATNQMLNLDWNQTLSNGMSSTNSIEECESSVNVVAKINMLAFMGSKDCEWEATSGDTWAFRLLHGRLRLSVRLAHRYDNATRTRVRADTAVQDVVLETVPHEKKNSLTVICVRFASEAMRYYIGRGCGRAADVPLLLRRCAAVARVALRWGRAMQDARLHLAYSLAPTGHLTLKVANIPLRSVWEVTMCLELVVDDARAPPWPRATGVRVTRVVAESDVSADQLARVLVAVPHDWGHVPHTVWKVFKYLKHKRRDDTSLLGY